MFYKRVVRFLKVLNLYIKDLFLRFNNRKPQPHTLLIVKTDAIGDYILFRNMLKYISESDRYRNYRITVCGNIIWKDLALEFDSNYIHNWIWIDRGKFLKDNTYRSNFLKNINEQGFETAVNPIRSRYLEVDDAIIKASNSLYKIGRIGDQSNIPFLLLPFSKNIYTKLYTESKTDIFEYTTTAYFIEQWLGVKVKEAIPFIELKNIEKKKYAILVPGSGEFVKQWNTANFAKIAKFIYTKTGFEIYIIGAKSDSILAQQIINLCVDVPIKDLCGATTLSELTNIIAEASLIVGNDTGAIHMAAALQTQTICLINGIHFARFGPYPTPATWMHFIYPEPIQKTMEENDHIYINKFRYKTPYNVNQITSDRVKNKIGELGF